MTDTTFEKELTTLLNKYSKENPSDTPDFILSEFLRRCLGAFDIATQNRDKWYNKPDKPDEPPPPKPDPPQNRLIKEGTQPGFK